MAYEKSTHTKISFVAPIKLRRALEAAANRERRSLSQMIVMILEKSEGLYEMDNHKTNSRHKPR